MVVCLLKRSSVTAERNAGMLFWWCKWRSTISPRVLENSVSMSCILPLDPCTHRNKHPQALKTFQTIRPDFSTTSISRGKLSKWNKITWSCHCLLGFVKCVYECVCVCVFTAGWRCLNLGGLIKRNEEQLGALKWRRKRWGKRGIK